ncbi:D12 class N6 adenine-specific DNA methyltransferase family protein, partial [Vibrio harveyi]
TSQKRSAGLLQRTIAKKRT